MRKIFLQRTLLHLHAKHKTGNDLVMGAIYDETICKLYCTVILEIKYHINFQEHFPVYARPTNEMGTPGNIRLDPATDKLERKSNRLQNEACPRSQISRALQNNSPLEFHRGERKKQQSPRSRRVPRTSYISATSAQFHGHARTYPFYGLPPPRALPSNYLLGSQAAPGRRILRPVWKLREHETPRWPCIGSLDHPLHPVRATRTSLRSSDPRYSEHTETKTIHSPPCRILRATRRKFPDEQSNEGTSAGRRPAAAQPCLPDFFAYKGRPPVIGIPR